MIPKSNKYSYIVKSIRYNTIILHLILLLTHIIMSKYIVIVGVVVCLLVYYIHIFDYQKWNGTTINIPDTRNKVRIIDNKDLRLYIILINIFLYVITLLFVYLILPNYGILLSLLQLLLLFYLYYITTKAIQQIMNSNINNPIFGDIIIDIEPGKYIVVSKVGLHNTMHGIIIEAK